MRTSAKRPDELGGFDRLAVVVREVEPEPPQATGLPHCLEVCDMSAQSVFRVVQAPLGSKIEVLQMSERGILQYGEQRSAKNGAVLHLQAQARERHWVQRGVLLPRLPRR